MGSSTAVNAAPDDRKEALSTTQWLQHALSLQLGGPARAQGLRLKLRLKSQEVRNTVFCSAQEKFHTVV